MIKISHVVIKKKIFILFHTTGIQKRIFIISNVYDTERSRKSLEIYINPQILHYSDERIEIEEGCLSIPRYVCIVERPRFVTV
jgi:peptide deformylase